MPRSPKPAPGVHLGVFLQGFRFDFLKIVLQVISIHYFFNSFRITSGSFLPLSPLSDNRLMQFEVFRLLTEVFPPYLESGILQRARQRGLIEVCVHNIRDYTHDNICPRTFSFNEHSQRSFEIDQTF